MVSAMVGFLVSRKLFGLDAGAWITAALIGLSIGSILTAVFLRFPKLRVHLFKRLRGMDTRSWGKGGT